MSTSTPNYALVKPTELTDFVDIDVINGNMDKIDTQMKVNADAITAANSNITTNTNDITSLKNSRTADENRLTTLEGDRCAIFTGVSILASTTDNVPSGSTFNTMRWTTTTQAAAAYVTHDNAVGATGHFIFQKTGTYRITVNHTFASSSTGNRVLQVLDKNNSVIGWDSSPGSPANGNPLSQTVTVPVAAVNDYIYIQLKQDSGAALGAFGGAFGYQNVTIEYIGS